MHEARAAPCGELSHSMEHACAQAPEHATVAANSARSSDSTPDTAHMHEQRGVQCRLWVVAGLIRCTGTTALAESAAQGAGTRFGPSC